MSRSLTLFLIFLFSGISCQEISKDLEQQIDEALCDVQCLDKTGSGACTSSTQRTACNCSPTSLKGSANITWEPAVPYISEPKLLCRDERSIAVHWDAEFRMIFLIEVRAKKGKWKIKQKTSCFKIKIENLKPNTGYDVRLWGVSQTGTVFGPTDITSIKTFSMDYTPSTPHHLNVVNWIVEGKQCSAEVEWKPAEDHACFYNIKAFPDQWLLSFKEYRVENINELYHIVMSDLTLEVNYTFNISSISGDFERESKPKELSVSTPTCLEAYDYNLTVCAPPSPDNVQITGRCYKDSPSNVSCDIEISWSKSEVNPDFYIVTVHTAAYIYNDTISGNETNYQFNNLPLDVEYIIRIEAWSTAGFSETFGQWIPDIENLISDDVPWLKIGSIAFGSACGIVAIGVLFYVRCKFRKLKEENDSINHKSFDEDFKEKYIPSLNNITTEYYIPEVENDKWHLNSEKIIVEKLLGEGAFGVVHKGFMQTDERKEIEVAIKMLKGNPIMDEIRQFEHEIEIMKSVGSHPHIVSLLGCCLKKGYLGPCLVVEYCAKGDLQTYLRAAWEKISGQASEERYSNLRSFQDDDFKVANQFSNKVYELCDDVLLEPKDLLSFARQIVLGMEHLSSLRVVHRDLAARNVLICGNRTVKVADFGLSRDVYQDNIYMKTGSGKLPVKWMALESLSHQQYTTQSDVWSFGIVLWEIVTLGGNPYTTVPPGHLLGLLRSGYRMECPQNCSQELYDVMQLCWREIAKERPTFSELRKILEKLIETKIYYVSLDDQLL